MAEVDVAGVGQDQGSAEPMLLLRERGGLRRYIAIWVGAVEATAVAAASAASSLPRPLTHQLLLDVVSAFGARLQRVEVTALVNDQFHAELEVVTGDGRTVTVSARASDAIALAVHQKCTIEASEAVLEEASLPPGAVVMSAGGDDVPDDAPPPPPEMEAEVERLREALAEATPEDFLPGDEPEEKPEDKKD